jgi:hypothetical protein
VHIDLDQRRFANAAEAVDLTGLDDENVAAACLEFLPAYVPEAAAFPHELDFIIRWRCGPGPRPGILPMLLSPLIRTIYR